MSIISPLPLTQGVAGGISDIVRVGGEKQVNSSIDCVLDF
jgi:hypothetical protein